MFRDMMMEALFSVWIDSPYIHRPDATIDSVIAGAHADDGVHLRQLSEHQNFILPAMTIKSLSKRRSCRLSVPVKKEPLKMGLPCA